MANPDKIPAQESDSDRRETSSANSYRRSIYSMPVTVTISIGQSELSVSELLKLQPESIVPLSSRIDDPVDLIIDNKVIAQGELIETEDGSLAIKLTEIVEDPSNEKL